MEERVPDILRECLDFAKGARRAVGTVEGHEVEVWLVAFGPVVPSVTVVVDDFFMKRRHFPNAQRAEEYFEWLKRKYGLSE